MNRSERRRLKRLGVKVKKDPVINIKKSDAEKMKAEVTDEAADIAFHKLLGLSAIVIHDKYPQLMRREDAGKNRTQRFINLILDQYESFQDGFITFDDLDKVLWEEAGVKIEREARHT